MKEIVELVKTVNFFPGLMGYFCLSNPTKNKEQKEEIKGRARELNHQALLMNPLDIKTNKKKTQPFLFVGDSPDVALHFSKFLPTADLVKMASVNRFFHGMSSHKELWKAHVKRFITENPPELEKGQTYKDFYILGYNLLKRGRQCYKTVLQLQQERKEGKFSIEFVPDGCANKYESCLNQISVFIRDAIKFGFEKYPKYFPSFTHKANVNEPLFNNDIFNDDYTIPLEQAAFYGRKNLIKLFIDMGADVNNTLGSASALCYAAMNGHQDCIALLIAHGADVNQMPKENYHYRGRGAALHLAAANGHLGCIQELLKSDLPTRADLPDNITGLLPIQFAMMQNHDECVNFLRNYMESKGIPIPPSPPPSSFNFFNSCAFKFKVEKILSKNFP